MIHVSHIPTYGFTILSDLDSKKGKLKQLFSELMHDKANKPIGAVFANAFAYAAFKPCSCAQFAPGQIYTRVQICTPLCRVHMPINRVHTYLDLN